MTAESINVVYTCDNFFIGYLAVSIDSLLENACSTTRQRLAIHVVGINYSPEHKDWLAQLVARRSAQATLIFHDYVATGKFSRSAYRAIEIVTLVYYLPEFFPALQRAIFVDADTLFMSDIAELWETELDQHWIATTPCVLDQDSLQIYNRTTAGHFWSADQTLNAGIMILELQKMRELGITRILEDWTEQHQESLLTPEQEAIAFNFPLRKNLPHKWNWRGALACSEPFWSSRSRTVRDDYSRISPAMVHFQAPLRPSNTRVNSKYFDLWKQRYHALGLSPVSPEKMSFLAFVVLMADEKWKIIGGRPPLVLVALRNFFHIVRCLYRYPRYRRNPEQYVIPGVHPINP